MLSALVGHSDDRDERQERKCLVSLRLPFSRRRRRVVWYGNTNVSKEHAASILWALSTLQMETDGSSENSAPTYRTTPWYILQSVRTNLNH
jgi:hypothetical protein